VVLDTETGPGSDEGRKGLKADAELTLSPRSLIVLM
jgi:glycogen operon protein